MQIFTLTLVSMGLAFLGVCLRQVCKQRCDVIQCWGVNIHRNVELECEENEMRIQNGTEFSTPRSSPSPQFNLKNLEEQKIN